MPKVVLDIRTRIIPDNHRCYILFPGDGYRFHSVMRDKSVVFLDIPGFPIDPKEDLSKAKDLSKRVVVSERIKEWHDTGRDSSNIPARDVSALGRMRDTTARKQAAGRVVGFFKRISAGDVIIVPGRDLADDVLFGEVVGAEVTDVAVDRYDEDTIPGRRVKWVKRIPRSSVPLWLERKIPSPNALRQIEASHFASVFDIMYERYYFNKQFVCKFDVKSSEFSSLDNFLFQQIILYIAALHENRHEDNIADVRRTPISVVASQIEFSEDIPDQRIEINSPGHIVIYAKNIIPIVAGAMIVLSATASAVGDGHLKLEVINTIDSGPQSSECIADVKDEVLGDLKAMGYDRWRELCEIEAQARKRTKLDSGMNATIEK